MLQRHSSPISNCLLAALPAEILGLVGPELEAVALTPGETVESAGAPAELVLFPISGVLSIFAESGDERVEIGMVGREGMIGLAVAFGAATCCQTVMVQVPGTGYRMGAELFRALVEQHRELRATILRYSQARLAQMSQAGLAHARRTVTERLARWLLMCLDRSDGPQLRVTHETLSAALGVRRPGVTVATHMLEGDGAIRARRGCISILDREKLVSAANGSYGVAERDYARLFGDDATDQAGIAFRQARLIRALNPKPSLTPIT